MEFHSNYGIVLNLTKTEARLGAHQGRCDDDIGYLRTIPRIRRQLVKIDPETLKRELREYGAWDDKELSDHDENLSRILWLACCSIVEGNGG